MSSTREVGARDHVTFSQRGLKLCGAAPFGSVPDSPLRRVEKDHRLFMLSFQKPEALKLALQQSSTVSQRSTEIPGILVHILCASRCRRAPNVTAGVSKAQLWGRACSAIVHAEDSAGRRGGAQQARTSVHPDGALPRRHRRRSSLDGA